MDLTYVKLYPKIINTVRVSDTANVLTVNRSSDLLNLITIFKHSLLHRMFLQDLSCLDLFFLKNRFELNYFMLSYASNIRLQLQHLVSTWMYSLSFIFKSANWLEREVFDLFGVKFLNSKTDIRRILTDYGFQGHPFRKDFPLSGFYELRYSESSKRVICEPVELGQSLRLSNNASTKIINS